MGIVVEHYAVGPGRFEDRHKTACGRDVHRTQVAPSREYVSCQQCRRALGMKKGERQEEPSAIIDDIIGGLEGEEKLEPNYPTHAEASRVFAAAPQFTKKWRIDPSTKWLRTQSMGSGGYARVYELDEQRIVKVTDDDGDAEAAMLALKTKTPVGIPKVFDVAVSHAIKGHPYYLIVMEQLLPMEMLDGDMQPEAYAALASLEKETVSRVRGGGSWRPRGRRKLGRWGKKWLRELREAAAWIERQMGRKFTDIHPGNVGLRVKGEDLQAVILDLGEASWGRGVEGIQEAS